MISRILSFTQKLLMFLGACYLIILFISWVRISVILIDSGAYRISASDYLNYYRFFFWSIPVAILIGIIIPPKEEESSSNASPEKIEHSEKDNSTADPVKNFMKTFPADVFPGEDIELQLHAIFRRLSDIKTILQSLPKEKRKILRALMSGTKEKLRTISDADFLAIKASCTLEDYTEAALKYKEILKTLNTIKAELQLENLQVITKNNQTMKG